MKWKGKKGNFLKKKENTKPLFWIICHIFVAYDWHECLSQFQTVTMFFFFFFLYTHTHTIRLLMFYSSPLMPSSEIDLFLNRNLFTFFIRLTHTASHLHTRTTMAISKEQKICNNFWNIVTFLCVCVEWNALLIRVYLCSNCLRVLTYVLFLCVFVVYLYGAIKAVYLWLYETKYKYNSQCYRNHWWNEMILAGNAERDNGNGGTMKNVLPIYWCGKVTWCLFSPIPVCVSESHIV